jgi:hypothetical protein
MVSISLGIIGSHTMCQIMRPKNKITMKSYITRLLFLVAIICILSISINTAVGLTITKGTIPANTHNAFFGDPITYTYKVTNNDGVILHDVAINDDKFGQITVGILGVGSSSTKTVSHTISESDFPGPLKNNALATGKRPDESQVISSIVSYSISLTIDGALTVSVFPDNASRSIGETVNYTIYVKSTYPVKLTNLTIIDSIYHPSAIALPITLNRTSLAPNQTAFGTVSYIVVQEDIRGPSLGIPGYGSATVTDTANAIARLPWWNRTNPDDQLAVGRSFITINVD